MSEAGCRRSRCECETQKTTDLVLTYNGLGPNAQLILRRIAERLSDGKRLYNDDFEKPRDWNEETTQELLDGLVYLTMQHVKAGSPPARRKPKPKPHDWILTLAICANLALSIFSLLR